MFSGDHVMLKTPVCGDTFWSWIQQLVGESRTGGISWKIMKNMKTGKVSKNPKNNDIGIYNFFTCLLFFKILVTLPIFMFFMIFQLILPVLLTPNNYCFHTKVIPPPDRLGVVDETFTKLDMVTSDFLWSQPNMVSVLILGSRKYGHHQIYLYQLNVGVRRRGGGARGGRVRQLWGYQVYFQMCFTINVHLYYLFFGDILLLVWHCVNR